MKRKYGFKTVVASVLVTAALAAPAAVLSSTADPLDATLIFEGASMSVCPDGSVQMLFNVAVDDTVNCRGASFHLRYNTEYLTPSYIADTTDEDNVVHKANEPVEAFGQRSMDAFFREDKELYGKKNAAGDPIQVIRRNDDIFGTYYSQVNTDDGTIDMDLWFDNEAITAAGGADGKLVRLTDFSNDPEDKVYVFNKHDEETATNQTPGKVVLGQLSFRVQEDRLGELIDLFDGMDVKSDFRDPMVTPARPVVDILTPDQTKHATTFLLDINYKDMSENEDPWLIGYYGGEPYKRTHDVYSPSRKDAWDDPTYNARNIMERYQFNFQRDLIVGVELTNPDFTINAYQNYTSGGVGDLQLSMGRYASMVTVRYADGTRENQPFPWGAKNSDYQEKYIAKTNLNVDAAGKPRVPWAEMTTSAITKYDPTADEANDPRGTDYIFTQSYQVYKKDANGLNVKKADGSYEVAYTFPIPVTGHMLVTPIKVLDVTAEDLTRTYPVDGVLTDVKTTADLDLPGKARIITDIVPGNVSLVTDIKGWTPIQPTGWHTGDPAMSTWPTGTGGKSMNSLKAKSYVTGTGDPTKDGFPYWPDTDDAAATDPANAAYAPDHFVGEYFFETAASNGGAAQGILRADIQKDFRWLTVPQESYPLDHALRKIVKREDYADAKAYQVSYVQTVTKKASGTDTNGTGQPTLTLAVEKVSGDLAAGSVFRVWLPNSLELGTGQNKGGVSVDNWFNNKALPTTDPSYANHVNGFYTSTVQAGEGGTKQIFHLDTNPSEPETPASTATENYYNGERETLRRYINLGGWYFVAICEKPGETAPAWTDPIPVYVPPRRNEYQENKIYNFIGENKGLFDWPGGVGSLLTFPRGLYTPVGPLEGDGSGQNIGLPLYDVTKNGVVTTTNAVADGADVFVSGNPYRLKEGVTRYQESYGVETLYDGQTGAQPGRIYSVKVDETITDHDADWTSPTDTERTHPSVAAAVGGAWPAQGDKVWKYGPTPLEDDYMVAGFGYVHQPQADLNTYKATLRRQLDQKDPQLKEKVTLTSVADNGITRQSPGTKADNVTLVTYNDVTQGYTVRQDHLLTINNVGDVDIYGLNIDSIVDGYNLNDNANRDGPAGGHFEITVPPASFLAAGDSTNFVLTYVYDLRANAAGGSLSYRDTLYITSTSHPTAGKGEDYLLDFDAELNVSDDPLHQVTVIYKPEDGTMGTAGLIVGEQTSGGATTMNTTATTRTYPQDETVYVSANLVDEYEIKSIVMTDSAGTVIKDFKGNNIAAYAGDAEVDEDMEVYTFAMPNQDVVVTVNFYEPLSSKLRLDHLIDFSAPKAEAPNTPDLVLGYDPAGKYEPADPGHIYTLWKKSFTGKPAAGSAAATGDYAAAQTWSTGHGNADEDFYLMTQGSAIPKVDKGDEYDSKLKHYLVVIDAEDDLSQIKATLRNVKHHVDYQGTDAAHPDGYNEDITPTVNMTLFYKGQVLENWTNASVAKTVYDPDHGFGPYDATQTPPANLRPQGDTAKKTQHTTDTFDSPAPGESAYVHIQVSYNGGTAETTGTRHYYVEIHRRTKEPEVVLHYGNSPYGMIMNEQKFITQVAAADQNDPAKVQAAKEQTEKTRGIVKDAFRVGYTFRGADASVLPTAAKSKLQGVTYWREAWVRNLGLFEPESFTAVNDLVDPMTYDPEVYDPANNLDLNDYAFFAIQGQEMWEPGVISAKDSSGRNVPLHKITAWAMDENGADGVTLLDTAQTKQVARFSGTTKEIVALGVAGRKLAALAEHTTPAPTVAVDAALGVRAWPAKEVTTTSTPAEGGDPVTTTSYVPVGDIRPGRYIIQYRYYDFDGDSVLSVSRPLVILRDVGDANVDGVRDAIDAPATGSTADKSDEYAIEDRVTHDPLGYEAGGWDATNKKDTVYPWSNIFKFRVTDVNNDRNINNIDANQVARNVKEQGGWLRFYDPVDYGRPGSPTTAPPSGS